MAKLKVQQVRSLIGRPYTQIRVMESLGLRKINSVVEHDDTPSIRGMINAVQHLVKVVK